MGPSGPGKKVSIPWDDAREADPWSGVAPAAGHEFIRTLPGPGVRTNLRAGAAAEEAMEAQYAGCIAFLRSEFQPWQPARCVIGDEIDELLADAWPDAEPDTLGLLRGPLQTAAVVASMRLLVLLAAEGQP